MGRDDGFDIDLSYRHMESIKRGHEKLEAEFERLRVEPSSRTPAVGDTVVVAAGLIGRGFDWVCKECLVVAVGETSVKVRFAERGYGGKPDDEWISSVLITDVIPKGEPEATGR